MCHGEHKQKFAAKPQNSTHKNAIPYKRKKKYRDNYNDEDDY